MKILDQNGNPISNPPAEMLSGETVMLFLQIPGFDRAVHQRIVQIARAEGWTVEQTVRELIYRTLGYK